MRLCLDEHYSPEIAAQLRLRGHDVCCVKERPELETMSDDALLAAMDDEQRAVMTENVADFAPIIQRRLSAGEAYYGVIYTSPRTMPRSRHTIGMYVEALESLLARHPGEHDFVNRTEWLRSAREA